MLVGIMNELLNSITYNSLFDTSKYWRLERDGTFKYSSLSKFADTLESLSDTSLKFVDVKSLSKYFPT